MTYPQVYAGMNNTELYRLDSLPITHDDKILVNSLNNLYVVKFKEENVTSIFEVSFFLQLLVKPRELMLYLCTIVEQKMTYLRFVQTLTVFGCVKKTQKPIIITYVTTNLQTTK